MENYEEYLNKYPGTILCTEELIYGYLQPTGILYGYPTSLLFLQDEYLSKWTSEETFKVLLLEGLILVDHIQKGKFDQQSLEKSLAAFVTFYEETELEKAKKSWLSFKGLTVYEKLESIIDQRVDIKSSFANKIWTSYLYNSLLFHDLLLYHEYQLGADPGLLREKREEVLLDMVKVVAAAANVDGSPQEEENNFFEIFIASADLDSERHELAEDFFHNRKTLDDIEFKYEKSWLLCRYILELAILTVWSDNKVVDSEHAFLNRLVARLGIAEEEKDKSFVAIQSFVNKNLDKIPFLQDKNDMAMLMSGATDRWAKILGRSKDKLALELSQSKELVSLIAKSAKSDLSKDEKEKLKKQFKDLARTIPSLGLFLLPGGSLLLPIILKIIPDLVPSAFRVNEVDDEPEEESPKS
ncbi:MAG: hypothetical protein HYZ14_09340 [Bacteroidetes bacterium]|nr:hypothetical protein [Bacteroidota bacterium]